MPTLLRAAQFRSPEARSLGTPAGTEQESKDRHLQSTEKRKGVEKKPTVVDYSINMRSRAKADDRAERCAMPAIIKSPERYKEWEMSDGGERAIKNKCRSIQCTAHCSERIAGRDGLPG